MTVPGPARTCLCHPVGGVDIGSDFRAVDLLTARALFRARSRRSWAGNKHNIVYRAAVRAVESGRGLEGILQQDPEVAIHLSRERLRAVVNPLAYTGLCAQFVNRVLAAVGRARETR